MTQITITQAEVCDQLAQADEVVELVSADGRRLGVFRPEASTSITPPLTIEELRRRTALPGGKTTAQVLDLLGRS